MQLKNPLTKTKYFSLMFVILGKIEWIKPKNRAKMKLDKSISFLNLFSSFEEVLMIRQLRQSPISFLDSLSIRQLYAITLLMDQSSLLRKFKCPLSSSLLRFLLLCRLRCFWLFLNNLLLGILHLFGRQLHQNLLGIYRIISIAFEFQLCLHNLSFHLKENQQQIIKPQITISIPSQTQCRKKKVIIQSFLLQRVLILFGNGEDFYDNFMDLIKQKMKEGGFSRLGEASSPLKQIIQRILPINIICFIQMIKTLIFWLAIIFLQISTTNALSTKSFTFDNQQSSKFRRSIFDIGNVLSDTTINLQLALKVGVTDLSAAIVQLIKSSDNSVINTFSCSGATCSQDYYVDSSSGNQMSIRIYAPDSSSFPPNIQIYNLLVRSYKGLPSDPPPGMRTLVRATDVLREEIVRVIYASKARTIHFSLFPIPTELSSPQEALRLFKVDPLNGWLTGYSNSITLSDDGFTIVQPGVGGDVLGLYNYSASVQIGFYALVVTYNVGNPNLKVTWETDSYNCTFSSSYPDVNAVFTGCGNPNLNSASSYSGEAGSNKSSDGTCFVFDPTTNICKLCSGGYFLNSNGVCLPNSLCQPGKFIQDGKCITNNPLCLKQDPESSLCLQCIFGLFASIDGQCLPQLKCPDRQFFSKGTCLDISPLCGNYSRQGLCTSCSDSSNFYLQEGRCYKRQLSCGNRQYISSSNTCLNVSESCGYYNPNNGACLTCINEAEEDVINGICKKVVLNCSFNEYQSGKVCLSIPPECFRFDKLNKVCLQCFGAYALSGQKCVQITCADRFYFSLSSQACVQVSELCQAYDKSTGACKTCKNTDYIINSEGKCVQSINPLAGCKARQQLGYGQCITPQQNCKIYNLDSQTCDQCNDQYELDYTGHCSLKAQCSQNNIDINGMCLRSPDNCQKVDSVGLCIKCVSMDYRIILGQCVYFKKCANKQYLNSFGQCIDVDPLCNLFNPSNGDCLTCIQPEASPHLGKCCPIGQLFNGKNCQSLTTQPQDRDPSACLQYHSSLYICLKCNPGYASDYSMKGTCVKE